ncbi:cat eye syndrome chromosome region [Mactra antiquata]
MEFKYYKNLCFLLLFISVSLKISMSSPILDNSSGRHGPASVETRRADNDDYMRKRQELILAEKQQRVGGEIVLNDAEKLVDSRLLAMKQKEIDSAHYNASNFAPQMSFLLSKELYDQSDVFKMIKSMPKGGALHVHDCSITDLRWLVSNATYRDNCYMCFDSNNQISFHFFDKAPLNPACPWVPVKTQRENSGNVLKFDDMLVQSMLLTKDFADKDINTVWRKFEQILMRANGLINYKPVFVDYFYEAMKEFHADNVQYIEIRALLPKVYELDGTTLQPVDVMNLYKDTTLQFVKDYPDFTGVKIIKTNLRFKKPDDILVDIKDSINMMKQFPEHFAGYDLVGQEDPGKTLLYYLDALRYPSLQTPPLTLPYFFHAGETDWEGTRVDDNLFDAVLLNTTRIGHGYAIPKHPEVMKIVKQKNIAIEVNPISNQVLKLVSDILNHPATVLLSNGSPVVISSDDPAVWGATGLSYDFYAAFMAMTGKEDGLKVLKQLSMNSLLYSALSPTEKTSALKSWETKWNDFISQMVSSPSFIG